MAKNTVKVFTIIKLEANTKENGSMIKSTDTESLTMLMETDTRAHGKMEKDLTTAFTNTQMEMSMTDSGKTILKKDTVSFRWLQGTNMRETGKAARKMVQVNLLQFRALHFC